MPVMNRTAATSSPRFRRVKSSVGTEMEELGRGGGGVSLSLLPAYSSGGELGGAEGR